MPKTIEKQVKTFAKEGARDVLRQNLQEIMAIHPTLKSRKAIELRTGGAVSARSVGYMLQKEGGNPTLANIEAVAGIYHLEVWELLMPGLDTSKVVASVSAREKALHRRIEDSMNALGISEYKVPTKKEPARKLAGKGAHA